MDQTHELRKTLFVEAPTFAGMERENQIASTSVLTDIDSDLLLERRYTLTE